MRSPDLERARETAALHLALVVDPSPAAQVDTEHEDHAEEAEAVAACDFDADASSLLPAAVLLATVASAWVANKYGAQWMVTEERAERIGRALVRVVNKYLPALDSFGPETELGIALGDWIMAGAGPVLEAHATVVREEGGTT